MIRYAVFLAAIATLAPQCLRADDLQADPSTADIVLDESGEFTADSQLETISIPFTVEDEAMALTLDTKVTLTAGKARVHIVAPDGKAITELGTGGSMTVHDPLIKLHGRTGEYQLRVIPENALGTWSVRIALTQDTPASPLSVVYLVPGVGMIQIGLIAVLWWRRRSGVQWRWFWAGAAVWTVGVALKVAWAIPLNAPILAAIEAAVPHNVYLVLGSIYIGLLTGVFEIGVTLIAALIWKRMSQDAARGVAVGIGAGAFEAILLGAVATLGVIAAFAVGGEAQEQLTQAMTQTAETTSLYWLAGPVERVIAILCHISSRALVLIGVARGKWHWPFFWGFMIMTVLDSVAGYTYLGGILGTVSLWWIELAFVPAALVSIPVTMWCIRSWPAPASDCAEPEGQVASGASPTSRRS